MNGLEAYEEFKKLADDLERRFSKFTLAYALANQFTSRMMMLGRENTAEYRANLITECGNWEATAKLAHKTRRMDLLLKALDENKPLPRGRRKKRRAA